jgi:hypothetical protein
MVMGHFQIDDFAVGDGDLAGGQVELLDHAIGPGAAIAVAAEKIRLAQSAENIWRFIRDTSFMT